MTKGYVGWALSEHTRNQLLHQFPPAYDRVIAHHCTLKFGVDDSHPLPTTTTAQVVGTVDDHMGVQALVLKIDGDISRADGSVYHITWSLGDGRRPVDSNKVIAAQGFVPLAEAIDIDIVPTFFAF